MSEPLGPAPDPTPVMSEPPGPAPDPTPVADMATPPKPRSPRRRRGRPSRARGRPNSSDEATARWTIRGVPSPVREMALAAADERGMTVGDWVAEAIVALARGRTPASPKLPATEAAAPPDIVQLVQSLDDRLTRMEARQQAGFFGRLFGRRR
jgi:hypothetical protein